MKTSTFRSLRARLAALILLTMALVTGVLIISYLHERSLILSHVSEDFTRLVTLVASDQEQLITRTRQFLITLAKAPEVNAADERGCPDFLGRLIDEYPRYSYLGILDARGSLICGAGQEPALPATFSREPWFIHSLRSRDFAMGPLQEGAEGSTGFAIAYPMIEVGDKVRTIVFAAIDLSHFSELISHLQPPGQVVFTMISRNGMILNCFPSREDCFGNRHGMDSLVSAMVEKGTGTLEINGLNDVDRLYAYAPLSSTVDTGLFIAVGVPISTLFTTANTILAYQFAGVWVVTTLALCLVWLGSSAFILNPVNAMVRTAQHLSRGDMDARTGLPHQKGELGSLARALDEMAEALENRALQVEQYEAQLRSMASELTSAEERERRRIAEGLHDRVGQLLGISKIKLGMLQQIEAGSESAELAEEIRGFVAQALHETRSLTFEISPPILYEIGLEAALEYLAERMHTQHGLLVTHSGDGRQAKPLDDDIRVLLYRGASELLHNVVKHARAHRAVVSTQYREDGVVLSVEDDGVGFQPGEDSIRRGSGDGFGLFSLRERLLHVGGRFSIESRPGKGSRIVLMAPLKDSAPILPSGRASQTR
jgi:signal transduction histidine kinase